MKNRELKIVDGAIFVADSHDGKIRDNFLKLLRLIETDKIKTTQLFLMGDMFDILIDSKKIKSYYQEYIDLINRLSLKIEIYYLEGNHDFGLKNIFPSISIYPIENQPVKFIYKDSSILLSHGDNYSNFSYKIFTKLLRSKITLFFLNFFDFILNYAISNKIFSIQYKKNLCKKQNNFKNFIKKRVKNYDKCDIIIEGHYHQGEEYILNPRYINIPSLACSNQFIIVKNYSYIKQNIFNFFLKG